MIQRRFRKRMRSWTRPVRRLSRTCIPKVVADSNNRSNSRISRIRMSPRARRRKRMSPRMTPRPEEITILKNLEK